MTVWVNVVELMVKSELPLYVAVMVSVPDASDDVVSVATPPLSVSVPIALELRRICLSPTRSNLEVISDDVIKGHKGLAISHIGQKRR